MPATFNRAHKWVLDEVITTAQLNAEFDNILNNLDPTGVGSYSTSVAQMQLVTSPGIPGSESQATSLGGEFERLRYMIKAILGVSASQWYSPPVTDLTQIKAALGNSLNVSRIISGPVSTNSSSSRFLTPGNTTAAVTVNGGGTAPVVYAVNGTNYTISTNLLVGSLGTAAAASAIINDPSLTGQEATKWTGEDGGTISITNVSAAITSLVGNWGAFSITDSGKTEYFMAYVQSSSAFTNVLRGYFFDNNQAAVQRIPINNNDTVSLLKLTWLYGNTASQVVVGYTPPTFSFSQPGAPATGDYWFNLSTNIWMIFNSAIWVTASATLLGVCAQNTANCIAARSFDYALSTNPYSNLILNYNSTTSLIAQNWGSKIGVGASLLDFKNTKPQWTSSSLDSNSTVAFTAATTYWAYVGELGQLNLSWHKPYQAAGNGQGWYHPYEMWRAVGFLKTNSNTAFDSTTLTSYTLDVNQTPAQAASYNFFVNGGFDYWQVATASSVTAAGGGTPATSAVYIPDQWYVNNILGGGGAEGVITGSQQASSNFGSGFGFKVQITTTPSGTGVQNGTEVYQVLSNPVTQVLINKTVSIGVLVKALGNVNQFGMTLMYNSSETKLTTNSSAIGTEVVHNINSTAWTLCTILNQTVGTIGAVGTGVLGVRFRVSGVSSGNAWDINNGFILEQAQLNNGNLSSFKRQFEDPVHELASCQYFLEKNVNVNSYVTASAVTAGQTILPVASLATIMAVSVPFKTQKRSTVVSLSFFDMAGSANKVSGYNTVGVKIDNLANGTPFAVGQLGFEFSFISGVTTINLVAFNWLADARI